MTQESPDPTDATVDPFFQIRLPSRRAPWAIHDWGMAKPWQCMPSFECSLDPIDAYEWQHKRFSRRLGCAGNRQMPKV